MEKFTFHILSQKWIISKITGEIDLDLTQTMETQWLQKQFFMAAVQKKKKLKCWHLFDQKKEKMTLAEKIKTKTL